MLKLLRAFGSFQFGFKWKANGQQGISIGYWQSDDVPEAMQSEADVPF
ncbi:MAG: hypothetical protein HOH59_16245 [Rhodospirillaceae bacterium]|jgi:hypothetical protein|nr:hypothetical protein [Rhodospirillaceae bacterium]